MSISILSRWFVGIGLLFGSGCAHQSYFKVTDPQTNNIYYTRFLENYKCGMIQLKDAHTGSVVTLPSSEVKELSKEEYAASVPAVAP